MSAVESTFRSGIVRRDDHATAYLENGPEDGLPVILVHGWPETSWAWRHQLVGLGARGHRVIAPDLRGIGRSTIYQQHSDYALRHHVADMITLADALSIDRAVWIGQDWGAPVVWATARHHTERFHAGASLNTPYDTLERGYERMVSFVNRATYSEREYPAGQVDYYLFYKESFDTARSHFEMDIPAFFSTVLRAGEPGKQHKPFLTATVRRNGGWFGGGPPSPLPCDTRVIDEIDLAHFVEAYRRTGFFGVNSLYLNDADNQDFIASAQTPTITFPAMFIGGQWDYVNDTEYSSLAEPMRTACTALEYHVLNSGHWSHHERRHEVTALIDQWLIRSVFHSA